MAHSSTSRYHDKILSIKNGILIRPNYRHYYTVEIFARGVILSGNNLLVKICTIIIMVNFDGIY